MAAKAICWLSYQKSRVNLVFRAFKNVIWQGLQIKNKPGQPEQTDLVWGIVKIF